MVVQKTVLTILSEMSHFLWSIATKNINRRGEMKALLALPFREGLGILYGGEDTSTFHYIFGTSITPFYVGGTSLLEDGNDFYVDDKFPILSRDCAMGLDGTCKLHS